METIKISVIIGSTRPNRFGDKPAAWISKEAKKLEGVEVELLDLRDYPMPFLDQGVSPSQSKGDYGNEIVNIWSKKIAHADAFIIVAPEYNHGTSGVLKNALDSIYSEWNNKPVGFVSYGGAGGARAVEHLRLVSIELQMVPIRNAVHIQGGVLFPILMGNAKWTDETEAGLKDNADKMLSQLLWFAKALKAAR